MDSPKRILKEWGLHPKKQFGQNFLADRTAAEKIIRSANIQPDDVVLEIGAGLGALTFPLAEKSSKLFVVEKDRQLIPILEKEINEQRLNNITLLGADILKIDLSEIFPKNHRPVVVVGNLPYNISSQVLITLVKNRSIVRHAVLMFQKELAQRIVSQPGGKDYGRISAMLQYCSEIQVVSQLPANCFFPKPKVDSQVLLIRFPESLSPAVQDEALLHRIIKAAFGKRRKTLKNALSQSDLKLSPDAAEKLLADCGISPSRRAETLSAREFVALSNHMSATTGKKTL